MPKFLNISCSAAISYLTTATFTGAFVITTAGNQYFGMISYGKALAWLAAISGGYVMAFSRGTKQFVEIKEILGKIETENENNTYLGFFCKGFYRIFCTLLIPQKKSLHPVAWFVWSLSSLAGFFRSVTQGLTSTKTLLNAIHVYNSERIYNTSIFVAFTNAVAFQNFTVNKTAENIHKLFHLPSGYRFKKAVTIIIGLSSIAGTFGYNNQQITKGFTTAPKLETLSSISIPIAITSVGIGGSSKAVQVAETLISLESKEPAPLVNISTKKSIQSVSTFITIVKEENKAEPNQISQIKYVPKSIEDNKSPLNINWSWKVKLHIFMGVLYVAFFCMISQKGLSPFMPDGLLWNILTWIIAGSTTVMEGPFTVGYMIKEQINLEKNEALKRYTLNPPPSRQINNLQTPLLETDSLPNLNIS